MSEQEKSGSLWSRVVDTVIVAGAASIVLGLLGGAVAFVWDKTTNMDKAIAEALAGVKATQEVSSELLDDHSREIQSIWEKIDSLAIEANPMARIPESEPSLPKSKSKNPVLDQYNSAQQAIIKSEEP